MLGMQCDDSIDHCVHKLLVPSVRVPIIQCHHEEYQEHMLIIRLRLDDFLHQYCGFNHCDCFNLVEKIKLKELFLNSHFFLYKITIEIKPIWHHFHPEKRKPWTKVQPK